MQDSVTAKPLGKLDSELAAAFSGSCQEELRLFIQKTDHG